MPSTRSKTSNPAKAPYRPRKKPAVARSNLRTTVQTYLPLPSLAPSTRPSPDLFVWGSSGEGQLGLGRNQHTLHRPRKHPWVEQGIARGAFGKRPGAGILSVASGGLHTYLLDENGTIWSCGVNDDGALGRTIKPPSEPATSLDPISLQEAMQFGALSTLVEEDFSTVQLAAGDSSGAALNENGELRVWGTFIDGSGGKSFSGDSDEEPLPVLIPEIRNEKIASVSSGDNHFLALTVNGEVYSWGVDTFGRLGRTALSRREMNPLSPDKVVYGPRRTRTVLIGTGSNRSFAVDSAGDVWAWGPNGRGQLGLGDALVGEIVAHPTRIDALTPAELERSSGVANNRVVQICGGEFHTVFLTSSGVVTVRTLKLAFQQITPFLPATAPPKSKLHLEK